MANINIRTLKKYQFKKINVVLSRFNTELMNRFDDFRQKLPSSIIDFTTDRVPEEERKKFDIILFTENFDLFTIIFVKDPELHHRLGWKKRN